MRKILAALVVLSGLALGSAAQAQSVPGFYVEEIREVPVQAIIDYTTATSTSGCTTGVKGCLVSADFSSSAPTGTPAAMPYSSRVLVGFFDSSSNGTLECDTITLNGINSMGFNTSETISTLVETVRTSATVWSHLSSFSVTGCSGGAASDILRISMNEREVGLPVQAKSTADILSVCYQHSDAASNWHCGPGSGITLSANGMSIVIGATAYPSAGVNAAMDENDAVRVIVRGRRFVRSLK